MTANRRPHIQHVSWLPLLETLYVVIRLVKAGQAQSIYGLTHTGQAHIYWFLVTQ